MVRRAASAGAWNRRRSGYRRLAEDGCHRASGTLLRFRGRGPSGAEPDRRTRDVSRRGGAAAAVRWGLEPSKSTHKLATLELADAISIFRQQMRECHLSVGNFATRRRMRYGVDLNGLPSTGNSS